MHARTRTFHRCFAIATGLVAVALIIATALPLLRSDAWWIRIFDFPRIQIAILLALNFVAFGAQRFWRRLRTLEYALATLVGIALLWQLISIAPYTTIYPKEMSDSSAEDNSNRISLLIYNVLSENREVEALRELIRETDPDIILLSEPNQWWLEQLDGLDEDYPYTLYQPQENDYGKLLYSRLELLNPEVRFLIEQEIPSLLSEVRLRSGVIVTLYGVHPRPPGLKRSAEEADGSGVQADRGANEEGEREDTDQRDAELLLVAKEVKKLGDVPVIVAGDFNDVA